LLRPAAPRSGAPAWSLDALAGIGLLTKENNHYGLTPPAAEFLVAGSPNYVGDMLTLQRIWDSWGRLTEVVRNGNTAPPVESKAEAEEFFPKLIRGLHVMNLPLARATAEVLGAGGKRRGMHVIDAGAGSGVWGIGIAEADRQARVTAQDYPGVLEHTRQYVKRHGLEDRFEYLAGDLKSVDFGRNRYDLALLGNIVHSEGERASRDLFRRIARSLRPGGTIVVIDMVPNDERSGPVFPLLFALNMLVNTGHGDTYTVAEYTEWLREAGFDGIEAVDIGSHSPIIVAAKA
jgi:ubiquinone/menaquinone biosynthesis C-methylase UbiE